MTQEKVLCFLGLEKNQKIDKTTMKIAFWFDFIYTIVIIGCGFLFELFSITLMNIIFISCLFLADIVFLVWFKYTYNPVHLISYCMVVYIITTLKLLYGYFIFSRGELTKDGYPLFSLAHIIVLIIFFILFIYLCIKFYRVYRDLKNHTVDYVISKIKRENKKSKIERIAIVIGSCSPIVLVRLFDDYLENMGLGIGFGFWTLACIWLWLACAHIPKYVVAKKYNAAKWFDDTKTDDSSVS